MIDLDHSVEQVFIWTDIAGTVNVHFRDSLEAKLNLTGRRFAMYPHEPALARLLRVLNATCQMEIEYTNNYGLAIKAWRKHELHNSV